MRNFRDLSEKCLFCPLEPNNFTSLSKKSCQNSLDLDQVVTLKQKDCMVLMENLQRNFELKFMEM